MSLSPSLPGSIKTIKHFAKSKSNYCYEDTLFFTDAELQGEYFFSRIYTANHSSNAKLMKD